MAAGILSACALGGADGGAPRGPNGPVKISYMTDWAGGQRLKTVEDALGLWQQKYPNITVDFHPTNEIHAKIVTDIAAGTQDDVVLFAGPLDAYEDVMPTPKSPRTGKATPIITDRPNGVMKRAGRAGDQMDASWLFTNFMSGPDVMGIVAEGRTSIPTHKAALNSARFLRKPPEGIGHLQKLILAAGFRLGLGKWGEWSTAVRAEIAKAWTGEVAPDTALRTATQIGDAALQRLGLP